MLSKKEKHVRRIIFVGLLIAACIMTISNTTTFAASATTIFQAHNWSAKNGSVIMENGKAPDDTSIGAIAAGDWVCYNGVDFGTGINTFMATVAATTAGKTIEIRLDSPTGTLIGRLTVAATGSWTIFNEQYASISGASGIHNLYLVFPSAAPANVNWFTFSKYNGSETTAQRNERMQWWREARFGQFIHWGAYSQLAGTYNGNESVDHGAEWIMFEFLIPKTTYENNAAKNLNPVNFDAVQWVNLCKAAGQKYMVITSKHHEGFSMFDTNVKDFNPYDIVNFTPYGQDPMVTLSQECKRQGIKFCFYYSILDWHHTTQSSTWGDSNSNKALYVSEMKEQLRELVEKYDPEVFWFDGQWKGWWTTADGQAMYRYLRTMKPSLIINNRVGKKADTDGDFGTPEQTIPATGLAIDWESCMTINGTWGYQASDTAWKSTATLIQNLANTASKGGNYLLNIGPKGDGTTPQASIDRLTQMGAWLNAYGESIYGTKANIYSTIPTWGYCTTRTGKMYLHVITWPGNGQISVPRLGNQILGVYTLKNPTVALNYNISGTNMVITLPGTKPDQYDSVIVVEVVGDPTTSLTTPTPTSTATPTPTPTVSAATPTPTSSTAGPNLALNKPVTCSSQQTGNEAIGVNDGDTVTRWSASPYPQWVRIDLGATYSVNKTELVPYSNRAYQYRIEVSTDGSSYTQVVDRTGNTTGGSLITDSFAAVNARYVRLTVTGCYNYTGTWASVNEFRVFGPGSTVPPSIPATPTNTPTPSIVVTPTNTPTPSVIVTPTPTASGGTNLALNKPVTCSSEQTGNEAYKLVDGDAVTNRWSASLYPQWVRIDLGAVYNINKTELAPLSNRAYRYKVEVSTDGTNYTQVVDRTGNTTGGSLLTDTFAAVNARYVRLTVTGCYNYTGTWISIVEFRVFGL